MIGVEMLDAVSSVLCLGAHPDDIEIGCGGTILKLLQMNGAVDVRFVIFSADDRRAEEGRRSAEALLKGAKHHEVSVLQYRESYFPYLGAEIKGSFDRLGMESAPDLVFTHFRGDLHQDHRLISELTWNTFRDQMIFEYEVPKYDGDQISPNVYLPLEPAVCDEKIGHLLRWFESQRDKHWFSEETFRATMRLRGIECRSPSGLAEGFTCRKLTLS